MAKLHRRWIPAVFTANTNRQVWLHGPSKGDGELHHLADALLVDGLEGIDVVDSLLHIISQEGRVTFNMVREVSPDRVSAGLLPPRSQLAQPYFQGTFAEVVDSRRSFTGENIANVSPSTDVHTGEFVLSFELDDEGKRIFCRITRDHVGERFAVLLDGKVLTAPRINEAICGGTGQISGNFTAESANELAIMMRAGALPAPLRIIEERAPDASAP